MHHELKILPKYMDRVMAGEKRFEIRLQDDKDFQTGDTITLLEPRNPNEVLMAWNPTPQCHIRHFEGIITYVTDYEQKKGYVVFGFKERPAEEGVKTDGKTK